MFIVHESKQNRLKPHRGGMVASGAVHAAPMELERIPGCAVTRRHGMLRPDTHRPRQKLLSRLWPAAVWPWTMA